MKNSLLILLLCFALVKSNAQCDSVYLRYTASEMKDAVVINDKVMLAAGDWGYIIKSNDGGRSWRNIHVDDNYWFKAITFTTDSIGYVSGDNGVMKTTDQGESWFPLNLNAGVNSMYFFDSNNGFLAGKDGHIYSTANGGRTFTDTIISGLSYTSIDFYNDSIGIVTGIGAMFKTVNRGRTWDFIRTDTLGFNLQFQKARFVSPSVVYAVGYPGVFIRSADSGKTWTKYFVPTGSGGFLKDFYFSNKDSGIVVGDYNGGFIMSTADGGQSFTMDFDNVGTASYNSIDADKPGNRFIVAGGGSYSSAAGRNILTSTDKGSTWTQQSTNGIAHYYHSQALNDSTVIISGYGGVMRKTYDYGETWKSLSYIPSSLGNSPYIFSFPDSLHGYAATEDLYATKDGGKSWTKKTLPGPPQSFVPMHMVFTDSTTGFVINYGDIYKTTNSAASWTLAATAPNIAFLTDIVFTSAAKGFAVGYNGSVLTSINNGSTWQTYDLHTTEYLRSVYFYNDKIGFIGTSDSIIYKTIDGGSSWTKINTHIRQLPFLSFAFSDELNGYALITNLSGSTYICRTKDGGITWAKERAEPSVVRNLTGKNRIYYVGENGLIVKNDRLTKPSIPGYIYGDDTSCVNVTKYYSTFAAYGMNYTWTLSGGGDNKYNNNLDTVHWNQTGNYILSVAAQNYCGTGPKRSLAVSVINFKPVIIQKDSTLTATAGISYQWYFNNSPIPAANGGNNRSLIVHEPGKYKVTVQSFYGCGETSDVFNYSTLPMTLLNFTAQLLVNDVILKWQTGSETNTNYFNIERSLDGINFKTIAKVKAAGSSNTTLNYQYVDSNARSLKSNSVFYRLKLVDKNGLATYSYLKMLNINNYETVSVTPNPFTSTIQLVILSHSNQNARITIASTAGTVMVNDKAVLVEGNNILLFSSSSFPVGSYVIKVKFEDGATASAKAIKN